MLEVHSYRLVYSQANGWVGPEQMAIPATITTGNLLEYFPTLPLAQHTFSTNTPPYHHPSHSLNLYYRLGKWLEVPRNTWFTVY
jgi:hypothetical protein